ncbi:hypothetical protein SK128_013394 [Halocaridina rubra]|uniref:Uncharacterized protein n=1 Tax=Halocaridina rubra TaxID=373956 RepID=A0AAN8X2L8_HALRR
MKNFMITVLLMVLSSSKSWASPTPVAAGSTDITSLSAESSKPIDYDQAPGAIADILTAVSDLMLWIREFESRQFDKRPEKFVALFPDFVRRTVEANARLEGRPVRMDERDFIKQIKGMEDIVREHSKEFQIEAQKIYRAQGV